MTIRKITDGTEPKVVRTNKYGGKMVVLEKDGKLYTRSNQALYAKAFGKELKDV